MRVHSLVFCINAMEPTPTPLPPLTFNYTTYEAKSLHLSFEAPANWTIDDTQTDTYILTNPDPSMDYAAQLSIRLVPVNKNYNKNELIKEVKNTLDTLGSSGFSKFERTNTAGRKFMIILPAILTPALVVAVSLVVAV